MSSAFPIISLFIHLCMNVLTSFRACFFFTYIFFRLLKYVTSFWTCFCKYLLFSFVRKYMRLFPLQIRFLFQEETFNVAVFWGYYFLVLLQVAEEAAAVVVAAEEVEAAEGDTEVVVEGEVTEVVVEEEDTEVVVGEATEVVAEGMEVEISLEIECRELDGIKVEVVEGFLAVVTATEEGDEGDIVMQGGRGTAMGGGMTIGGMMGEAGGGGEEGEIGTNPFSFVNDEQISAPNNFFLLFILN